jgi:hypothetical protein
LPQTLFSNFSFPSGSVTPEVKTITQKYFDSCRGIQKGINRKVLDLNLLRSVPLYSNNSRINLLKFKRYIKSVAHKGGWLIFYTHDVNENPKPYSCTPELLEQVVKFTRDCDLPVITIRDAINYILKKKT